MKFKHTCIPNWCVYRVQLVRGTRVHTPRTHFTLCTRTCNASPRGWGLFLVLWHLPVKIDVFQNNNIFPLVWRALRFPFALLPRTERTVRAAFVPRSN